MAGLNDHRPSSSSCFQRITGVYAVPVKGSNCSLKHTFGDVFFQQFLNILFHLPLAALIKVMIEAASSEEQKTPEYRTRKLESLERQNELIEEENIKREEAKQAQVLYAICYAAIARAGSFCNVTFSSRVKVWLAFFFFSIYNNCC